jgi:hypothetical protein
MGIVSLDDALVTGDGLNVITVNGESRIYDSHVANWSDDCEARALTALQDGYFYYLPGCNGSPVLGGRDDGSGVAVVAQWTDLGELPAANFASVGRAPRQGAVVLSDSAFYYFDEGGARLRLDVTPQPTDVVDDITPNLGFYSCVVAVGPTKILYVACPHHLYRAVPQAAQ